MTQQEFYEMIGYLASPTRQTNIEVEMPERRQPKFISEYALWTTGYPLPTDDSTAPYYVWPGDADKYGLEIRAYFISNENMPNLLDAMLEPRKRQNRPGYENWERRISRKEHIVPLLKHGFILGINQQVARIISFIPAQFMGDFNRGLSL
jgi:hypothetical protein